jgi:spermidine synthase
VALWQDLSPAAPPPGQALSSLWSTLILHMGLPVVALATCAPLLQRWFSRTGHDHAPDPYFLYGASNLGSLLALLAYPLLLEPSAGNSELRQVWALGLLLQGALVLACGLYAWRHRAPEPATPQGDQEEGDDAITWPARLRWLALSAVPSALLVSVTEHLTTNLSALPLLWVTPLALYLLTFVLAFSRRNPWPGAWLPQSLGIWTLVLVCAAGLGATEPAWLLLPLHMLTAAGLWWALHRALAAARPSARRLTGFYLWLSLGGALGGAAAALLAPTLLPDTWEHPLFLLLALALLPARASSKGWAARVPTWALLPLSAGAALVSILVVGPRVDTSGGAGAMWLLALPVAALYAFLSRPRALALGLLGVFLALLTSYQAPQGDVLWSRRNFYGVIKVAQRGDARVMIHGDTLHGRAPNPPGRCQPGTYYHPSGPLGQALTHWERPAKAQVGVIGLGVGSMACYGRPGEAWTFYEINPAVIEAAQDPSLLGVLASAPVKPTITQGDARAQLQRDQQARHHLLVVDAFSSDAIPVHLLTREALELYRDRLHRGGWLLFNVSNRMMELRPVLAAHARAMGMVAWQWEDRALTAQQQQEGKTGSRWVAMSPWDPELGQHLGEGWSLLRADDHAPRWTDDASSLLSVLKIP